MKHSVYYLTILGLLITNIQCSDNSYEEYNKKRDANYSNSGVTYLPQDMKYSRALLIVQSVDSFAGSSEFEYIKNSFLGNLPLLIADSLESQPADPNISNTDTIPASIDASYIVVKPERPGIFGISESNYMKYAKRWWLDYQYYPDHTFRIIGSLTRDLYTNCRGTDDSTNLCTIEFVGKDEVSDNTFSGTFEWNQYSSGGSCDINCIGKMSVILLE